MRLLPVVSWLVLITACSPVGKPVVRSPARMALAGRVTARPAVVKPDVPRRPPESARVAGLDCRGIVFEGVAFDDRCHRLVVADQAGGPGSRFPDAAAAGSARGGLAAVNGGFFTPAGDPMGLVVAAGQPAGAWNTASSLGSAAWHENPAGHSAITRREILGRTGASGMRELIQAGPMLVENGRTVAGLDPLKASVRTLVLWDGGNRWWIGRASACSLAQLAAALTACQPAGWTVRHALNMDGGRSADLWVAAELAGGPFARRPPWNRPVRNFLVLVPR